MALRTDRCGHRSKNGTTLFGRGRARRDPRRTSSPPVAARVSRTSSDARCRLCPSRLGHTYTRQAAAARVAAGGGHGSPCTTACVPQGRAAPPACPPSVHRTPDTSRGVHRAHSRQRRRPSRTPPPSTGGALSRSARRSRPCRPESVHQRHRPHTCPAAHTRR